MAENSFKYIKAVSLLKSRVDTAFMVGEEGLVSYLSTERVFRVVKYASRYVRRLQHYTSSKLYRKIARKLFKLFNPLASYY